MDLPEICLKMWRIIENLKLGNKLRRLSEVASTLDDLEMLKVNTGAF